ncbi:Aerobic cobaltochelatase subunit CobN [Tepidimonas alkaliphilus]|uniref:Aerobic cobaltochelatase subunit CobN n=1 Tax=Tepidimonas alkaliphilus TaxID=2588942 RepID=A0A554W4J2_9BURK|nr:cobaltochelatase subunit CobN [Tepidimonas alkaliphilus]TSE18498.1 Aerobic cobaltochelatase subunit CobN [Tepidimonas alkaliphilus]
MSPHRHPSRRAGQASLLGCGLLSALLALLAVLVMLLVPAAGVAATSPAVGKVAILSTSFVLERKFTLMEQAARGQGVELDWVQVDRAEAARIARALDGARLVILDAPRQEDQAQVERAAGEALRRTGIRGVSINVMSPPVRLRPLGLAREQAQRIYDYYTLGMPVNRERLFAYLADLMRGGDGAAVPAPQTLPDGGIYHPAHRELVHEDLPGYLAWWSQARGQDWRGRPVIGIEMSSSYISDAQTRLIDTLIEDIERRGGVPLAFYRNLRGTAPSGSSGSPASGGSAASSDGPQAGGGAAATSGSAWPRGGGDATSRDGASFAAPTSGPWAMGASDRAPGGATPDGTGMPLAQILRDPLATESFPNPRERAAPPPEPLITLQGRTLPNVLLVYTFLGMDPDGRRAWLQSLDIPAVNLLVYRTGSIADYRRDLAGVPTFFVPFNLTTAEYIGLIDPVVVGANEGGEIVPIPEQVDLLLGKAFNLVRLQTTPNAEKRLALFFWNHPPGQNNQGASNLNVPRSIERLTARLREAGYRVEPAQESAIIAAVRQMQEPAYRRGTLARLMQTPHWDFLPLARYRAYFDGLPADVRQRITDFWGAPEKSPWFTRVGGQPGFVVPRLQLGQLVVLPQPWRGETAWGAHDEKKSFHDTKMPLSHHYIAVYLWAREQFGAHAIVHLGTHGTQEWTPGKERGLWAWDDPNLLVRNTPVVYPYIVDNIGEALHVKRRGRGVIVSHQTPPFTPAGLSEDFVRLADLVREYEAADEGLVREGSRKLIIEQAVRMNVHRDLKWKLAEVERDFDRHLRELQDWLESLGEAQQPLGLHTLGETAPREHLVVNVMQMLGEPLYRATGVTNPRKAFAVDFRQLRQLAPYRFVDEWVFSGRPLAELADPTLRALAERGRRFAADLRAEQETEAVLRALAARWVMPSYGGDPIRNPDALPTGRNVYGFDPSRVPTRSAYEAGKKALDALITEYRVKTGQPPTKLAFTMWSTETLRHLGILEAQALYALGVRPRWDAGGRVIGMEVIPITELGRPRIDVVISMTGLWRDQFPNVMERLNEAIALVEALPEEAVVNPVRANTARVEQALRARGIPAAEAREFALTRLFGNESGDYGTGLPEATLASDQWNEGDGRLENLYLARMSWGYGPNQANWSRKLRDAAGQEVNVYAEHLRGTSAAVFSRSSNLRGLLDTDHPFEYLGGISLAVRHLDGKSPQLFISNLRDPNRARLQGADNFLAMELRSVYHHPNWVREMQAEGYSGAQQLLNIVNNFWGWQVMDRSVVRNDQWQDFKAIYVDDRYKLGLRAWFEKHHPAALAQITERMLEAIRKGYWQADEATQRDLARTWLDIARRHDVQTLNETFKAYVAELTGGGFGLGAALARPAEARPAAAAQPARADDVPPPAPQPPVVRGQQLVEQPRSPEAVQRLIWTYALLMLAVLAAGAVWQAWLARHTRQRRPAMTTQP